MDHRVALEIDRERCTGCGLCIPVCSHESLSLAGGAVRVSGDTSSHCGHCAAACPTQAITVTALDAEQQQFQTFDPLEGWLPPGGADTAALVHLMRSRRSCRNFLSTPVAPQILHDLVKIGITAPSGTNCQPWTFTLLGERAAVEWLGRRVAGFYRRLNRLASNFLLRQGLSLMGKPQLKRYYEAHHDQVADALQQFARSGRDLLFHGATAAMVVGSRNDASCPAEDALLATQNILLAAHAMGLGSCLIGFAVEALRRDRSLLKALQIPDGETPHAVIALGYPNETYQRPAGRFQPVVRWVREAG